MITVSFRKGKSMQIIWIGIFRKADSRELRYYRAELFSDFLNRNDIYTDWVLHISHKIK